MINIASNNRDNITIEYILAPVVKGRKGHYRELFEQVRKQGFLKVRVDGEIKDIIFGLQLDRYKVHDIEIVIDRIKISESTKSRLTKSLQIAMKHGKGMLMIMDNETNEARHFSKTLMCVDSGISYDVPEV